MVDERYPAHGIGPPYLLFYAVPLLAAELSLLLVDALLGILLHGSVLLVASAQLAMGGRPSRQSALVVLLPLTRLVSLVVPEGTTDPALLSLMKSAPLLLAAILLARAAYPEVLRLVIGRPRRVATQVRLAALCLPVGLLMLQTGGGGSMTTITSPGLWPAAVLSIAVFEEVLFRGLVQRAAAPRGPMFGILLPNALYGTMYLGSGSAATVAAMTAVGLIFSLCVLRTDSLWGVIGAHALGRTIAALF